MATLSRYLVLHLDSPSPLLTTEEKVREVVRLSNVQWDLLTTLLRNLFGEAGETIEFFSALDMGGNEILHLADPSTALSATNRQFVESLIEELRDEMGEVQDIIHDELPVSGRPIILTRAVPTTVDDIIELGNFNLTNDAHTFDVAITVSDSSFSVAKAWTLVINRSINSDWQIANPLFDTGAGSSQNLALDVKQVDADSKVYLRLRRTAGTTAGTATIQILPRGVTTDSFNETSATGSVTAPTLILESAILTVVDRRVGINTTAPANMLHVVQTNNSETQLKLSDSLTPSDATFKAAGSLLDIDVIPASGATAAAVRLFRATNTSGATSFVVLVGDGSATINALIAGNGNSYLAANNGNVSIGSSAVGASAVKVVLIATGTVPSSSPADSVQFFSIDASAGNACLGILTEAGNLLKLFTGASLTAPSGGALSSGGAAVLSTSDSTILSNAIARIAELEARLQAHGLLA